MKILIIPDAHAHPDYDNERFTALGNLVVDQKPDMLLCLGDAADMNSLCSYDKGTKGFEGRRYNADIESVGDAMDKFDAPIAVYNRSRAKKHLAAYKPDRVFTLGNHEHRIHKLIDADPRLDGTVSLADLTLEKRGWKVYPYGQIVNIEGFAVAHNLPSGVSGRPVGGANMASRLLSVGYCSSIVGHSHILDYSARTDYTGSKIRSISAGCFVHPGYREGWCINTRDMWWLGVIMLETEAPGWCTVHEFSMERIAKDYGKVCNEG